MPGLSRRSGAPLAMRRSRKAGLPCRRARASPACARNSCRRISRGSRPWRPARGWGRRICRTPPRCGYCPFHDEGLLLHGLADHPLGLLAHRLLRHKIAPVLKIAGLAIARRCQAVEESSGIPASPPAGAAPARARFHWQDRPASREPRARKDRPAGARARPHGWRCWRPAARHALDGGIGGCKTPGRVGPAQHGREARRSRSSAGS